MTRRRLIRQSDFPYHATNRSNNKEWFAIPLCDVWKICLKSFEQTMKLYPVKLHAFVLMSNHYHMILSTPECNIDRFMQVFNKKVSEMISARSGVINQKFGGRYNWSIIDSRKYHYNVYRYVFQNPMRSRMIDKCEEYPYSTLFYEVNQMDFVTSLESSLEYKHIEMLEWFNDQLSELEADGLRRGLKHGHCKVCPTRDSKKMPNYTLPSF